MSKWRQTILSNKEREDRKIYFSIILNEIYEYLESKIKGFQYIIESRQSGDTIVRTFRNGSQTVAFYCYLFLIDFEDWNKFRAKIVIRTVNPTDLIQKYIGIICKEDHLIFIKEFYSMIRRFRREHDRAKVKKVK